MYCTWKDSPCTTGRFGTMVLNSACPFSRKGMNKRAIIVIAYFICGYKNKTARLKAVLNIVNG
jgi:hypothetical protein